MALKQKLIPVFMIAGLLESGKTTFIKDTISGDDAYKTMKSLVLACEEGEIEYEESFLKKYNSTVKYFDSQEEFTLSNIEKAILDTKPDRIIIEMNGMWDLTKIEFPKYLRVFQVINFINFSTFPIYFMNMRQRFLDFVKQANNVIFTNVKDSDMEKLESYSSTFKLTNNQCQFLVMDEDGRCSNAFEIELPYDLDSEIVKIEPEDFGIFYIDTFDRKEKYEGKVIDTILQVFLFPKLPKGTFIGGRMAMTCCSNDVQLYGHLSTDNAKFKLKDRMWVRVVAEIKYEWNEEYQEEECIFEPRLIEQAKAPKDEIIDLTK